jgi:hypothetical protein
VPLTIMTESARKGCAVNIDNGGDGSGDDCNESDE